MLALKSLQLTWRCLHSNCRHCRPAADPGYFGLFHPLEEGKQPPQQPTQPAHDDAHAQREHLRAAFCDKMREWARTTPPEYISRPLLRLRSHHRKPAEAFDRKEADNANDHDSEDDNDSNDENNDVDDDELDVVDDEDELNVLDEEDEEYMEERDRATYHQGFHDVDVEGMNDLQRKSGNGQHRLDKDTNDDDKARRKKFPCDPQNDGRGDADEELYYYTEKGKLKYKPILIIAPKDEIYQRLSQSGLVSSRLKRPLPVLKLLKKTDAEIVGWYYYCSIELLQFFRICHNLKEVKAIVEYHIRWSAIRTLAKKYRCNPREIIKKYGRDLECEDKKGKKVRLMTRQEIKEVVRGVNKRVQMYHRFLALNILDEMD